MRLSVRIAAVIVVVLALAGCGVPQIPGHSADGPDQPRPVLSLVVQPMQANHLRMVGTIVPRFATHLGFQSMGRLVARDVSVGDVVTAGEPIASIEGTSFELAVRAAEAELRSAQAQLENARSALDRQTSLRQSGVISQAVLESTDLQFKTAQALVESAAADLQRAQDLLADTRLVAEFNGVVIAVSGEVGQVVTPGQAVVTLADPQSRDAVIDVPDLLAATLTTGDGFDVLLELDPRIAARGAVREIAPQADLSTRTFRIAISLTDPPNAFRFGTTVYARPDVAQGDALYQLPASALTDMAGRDAVWVVDPNSGAVTLRDVGVVSRDNGTLVINQGLAAGDRVVIAGVNTLASGQIVRVEQDQLQ